MMLGETLHLRSHPYTNDEDWRRGFDDALVSRRRDRWVQLMVEKGDVRRLWPFEAGPETHTGMPGRPALAKHLIEDELRRRAAAKSLEPRLSLEAEALLEWLKVTYPSASRPTAGTIENNIRAEYTRLKRPTE